MKSGSKTGAEQAGSPDITHIVIEDGAPVDNIFSERQMRLLPDSLHASWDGNGRRFLAFADVGLFYTLHEPPIVPDVMVSLDVDPPPNLNEKKYLSYFVWEFGKPPDIAIEIVSNRKGNEEEKLKRYREAGVSVVALYDPQQLLSKRTLRLFIAQNGGYVEAPPTTKLTHIGLGFMLWTGEYLGVPGTYLRWCDLEGNMLLSSEERAFNAQREAEAAQQQAQAAQQQAQAAQQQAQAAQQQAALEKRNRARAEARAERLAARLQALGIEDDLD